MINFELLSKVSLKIFSRKFKLMSQSIVSPYLLPRLRNTAKVSTWSLPGNRTYPVALISKELKSKEHAESQC